MRALKALARTTLSRLGLDPSQLIYNWCTVKKRVWQALDRSADEAALCINMGGTRFFKRHWRVMDYRHPTTRHYDFPGLDYNHDLMSGRPFPFADNSVALFYSSHTLEHILDLHLPHILAEIHRCLKPGGAVRLTMPDFDSAYRAFMAKDGAALINLGGDQEHDRWRGAVRLYGEAAAARLLPGWPRQPMVKPAPTGGQALADLFLDDFAAHRVGRMGLDELEKLAATLSKEDLARHLVADLTLEWKQHHPEAHGNWFTWDKLKAQLEAAGFKTVYRSAPFESRFPAMVGVGKYWSFDHLRMDTGLYVEAVKD